MRLKNKENLISLKQACTLLKCHPNSLRNWDKAGKLRAVRVGSRQDRRYYKDDILKFLDNMNSENAGKSIPTSISIPLLGMASCGTPEFFANDNIEEFISVDENLVRGEKKNYYLLRTSGTSMENANIPDKSLALIERADLYEEGNDVVVAIDGLATIKRMYRGNSALLLMPVSSDDKHKPIVAKENFYIAGRVVCTVPDPNALEEIRYVNISEEN
jgi:SOS-response transcriptional repressor LexA